MSCSMASLVLVSISISIIQVKCQSLSIISSKSLRIRTIRPTIYPPSTIEYCDPEPDGPDNVQADPMAFLQRSPLKALLGGKKKKEKDSGKDKKDKKKDKNRAPSATGTIDPKLQRLIVDATLVGVVTGISAAIG